MRSWQLRLRLDYSTLHCEQCGRAVKTKSILIKICQTAFYTETLQESKLNFEASTIN